MPAPPRREDRWIVSRLDALTGAVNNALAAFELGDAQQKLYDFVWNDFCDWYIEMAKVRLRSDAPGAAAATLAHTLERSLRLLHPFMPFVTEEIWQNLTARLPAPAGGARPPSVMVAPYPQVDAPRAAPDADAEVDVVMQTIRAVRNMRAQLRIPAGRKLEAAIETNGMAAVVNDAREVISALARVEPLRILEEGDSAGSDADAEAGVSLVVNPLVVRLPLAGVNLAAEAERLDQELAETEQNRERVRRLLDNANFVSKARPEVVANERQRLLDLTARRERLADLIARLRV